jgi:hypothetical protein
MADFSTSQSELRHRRYDHTVLNKATVVPGSIPGAVRPVVDVFFLFFYFSRRDGVEPWGATGEGGWCRWDIFDVEIGVVGKVNVVSGM